MASKAIYSEIVELVLSVDKYEAKIKESVDSLKLIQATAATTAATIGKIDAAMISGIDAAIIRTRQQAIALSSVNQLIKERNSLLNTRDNAARIDLYGGKRDLGNFLGSQATARADMTAKAIVIERAASIEERIARHAILADENARVAAVQRRAMVEEAATKRSMGYRVGSGIANTRASDSIGMAAGGAFLMGNTNVGGALYMIERLARHTELGKKALGELTQSFFGVTTGAGASATAIAAFGSAAVIAGGIAVAIAVPIAAMFAGNKLDNAIANMSTLLADATIKGDDFARMMNSAAGAAARLGEGFGIGLVETVAGFKTALSTGIDASQLEEFGVIAATVTKGLGTTFEDATGILTTFRDSYQLSMSGLQESSDVLFNAINVGKFQVDDLKNNIGRVVTASAEAGVSLKDMSAGLATLTRVGLSTSQSITSLNRFIQNIVSPTDKAKAAFDRLGLSTGHAAFKTQSLMQYLTQLKGAVGGNADLMGELFSTEQGRRGAIGLTTNLALTGELRTAMDEVGTATIAANRAMDTFSQNFGKLFQTVWDTIQLVGRDLLQAANSVFFPGGPLGADNLVQLKTILEGVGLMVKEIGNALILVFSASVAPIRVLYSALEMLSNFAHGDFAKGFRDFGTSITNIFTGLYNGVTNFFSAIGISADRVGENIAGVGKSVDKTVKKMDEGKKAIESIFGDDAIKAITTYGEKSSSVYDKMLQDIRKVRFEAAKLQWEQANPSKPTALADRVESYEVSPALTNAMKRLKLGRELVDLDRDFSADQIDARGGLDPRSDEGKKLQKIWEDAQARKHAEAGTRAGKAYAESRRKAMEGSLTDQGYGDLLPRTDGGMRTADDQLDRYEAILGLLDAIEKKYKITSTVVSRGFVFGGSTTGSSNGTATDTTTRVLSEQELLDKAKDIYAKLRANYELHKTKLLENDRKFQESQLQALEAGIKKQQDTVDKEKLNGYKKEYDYQLKIYNLKMQHIENERKKLEELRGDVVKAREGNRDTRERDAAERNPGKARRDYKEAAETDIRRASQMSDPDAIHAILERAAKTLDKMVDTGDASGRAKRDRSDMLKQIEDLQEKLINRINDKESKLVDKAKDAERTKNAAIADNPVAQAAIGEARKILQAMATEAVKHGITMSGDLNSAVEVNIEANLPIGDIKDAIVATVKAELARKVKEEINGANPGVDSGSNVTPKGTDRRNADRPQRSVSDDVSISNFF